MKTKEEILATEPVFLEYFKDEESVFNDFQYEDADYKVLFACYSQEFYEGDAYVLATKEGELYEVLGGHCSCYGLEGQWSPELVVLKELENRMIKGNSYRHEYYGKELKQFLGIQA